MPHSKSGSTSLTPSIHHSRIENVKQGDSPPAMIASNITETSFRKSETFSAKNRVYSTLSGSGSGSIIPDPTVTASYGNLLTNADESTPLPVKNLASSDLSSSSSNTFDATTSTAIGTPSATPGSSTASSSTSGSNKITDTQQERLTHASISSEPTPYSTSNDKSHPGSSNLKKDLITCTDDHGMIEKIVNIALETTEPMQIIHTRNMICTIRLDLEIFTYPQDKNTQDAFYRVLKLEKSTKGQQKKARKAKNGISFIKDPLALSHRFLILGRLSADRKSSAESAESPRRDLQYLVGLNVSSNPRSLWLIYDYMTDDHADEYFYLGDPLLDTAFYHDLSSNATPKVVKSPYSFLGRNFDVGLICADVQEWDTAQCLEGAAVERSLKTSYFKGTTLRLKAPMLSSGVSSSSLLNLGPSLDQEQELELTPRMRPEQSSKLGQSSEQKLYSETDRLGLSDYRNELLTLDHSVAIKAVKEENRAKAVVERTTVEDEIAGSKATEKMAAQKKHARKDAARKKAVEKVVEKEKVEKKKRSTQS